METQMSRLSWRDGHGFLIAAALTTAPLLAVTWFVQNMSKDSPIGLPAYYVPVAVGVTAAAFASIAAILLGRDRTERGEMHVGCGLVMSLLLVVTFCVWWGDWSLRFAKRFRDY